MFIWSGVLLVGFWWQAHYGLVAGAQAATPASWPEDCGLHIEAGCPRLVMAMHPKCPCTLATIEELSRIRARLGPGVQVTVLCYVPRDGDASWLETRNCSNVRRIPNASLVPDTEGEIAARFGMHTSGHVAYFDGRGSLIYSGGVTPSRGMIGSNPGTDAILCGSTVRRPDQGKSARSACPIFGCPLSNDFSGGHRNAP